MSDARDMIHWLEKRFPAQPIRWALMLRILCNLRDKR